MQVFKSFFKVLRKYIGQMIMYVGILCGVMVVFINVGNTDPQNYYKDKTIKYAVSDEDGSEMSRKLMAYLNDTQQLVYGVDMDERGIQDALYNRAVDCVIRIPDGFGDAWANDTADGLLEITTIPGSQASMLFETRLDSYMNMVSLYKRAGDDVNDACLLYTSDAADEEDSGDFGGGRIIKKKKNGTISTKRRSTYSARQLIKDYTRDEKAV